MEGLEFVRAYIDDVLITTSHSFQDHLEKLKEVFRRLKKAGLKVNAKKSFFARGELEYLGYWITRDGIQPVVTNVRLQSCVDGVTDGQTQDGGANQDPPNGLTDEDMTSGIPTGTKSHRNVDDISRSAKRKQESEHT